MKYTICIIDDEQSIRDGITMALESEYRIQSFADGEAALAALRGRLPDLVLLDVGLPGMNGIAVLREIRKLSADLLVIMVTAYEDLDTVISAMKLGAYDYVVKPLHMDGLEVTIRNALETVRLRKEVQVLQEKYLREHLPCFIAESNAIQDIMEFIGVVAKSPDTPILIVGETGTGKELIAGAIHYRSPNFKGPFVTVNCAAIPKDLIESELFGYEKGAFSGASPTGKPGLIEEAANGTLFLDEMGDLSLEAQAKLLRFLEEGELCRVGGTKKFHVKTRVVSATNKDLDHLMEKDLFRRDLYFRLAVIKVVVPSLNDRRDDIIPLAKHFLLEYNGKFSKNITRLSADAERALLSHRWTGNVRELRNYIEKAVLIGQGRELSAADLGIASAAETRTPEGSTAIPKFPPLPPAGVDFSALQESMERYYIAEALRLTGGNESKAAALLGMNHHTFRYHHKKLNKE